MEAVLTTPYLDENTKTGRWCSLEENSIGFFPKSSSLSVVLNFLGVERKYWAGFGSCPLGSRGATFVPAKPSDFLEMDDPVPGYVEPVQPPNLVQIQVP